MNKEVRIANKNSKEQKVAARATEKRLDDEIAEHNRKRNQREEDEIRNKLRAKEEKEREVQRLRDL